MNTPVVPVFEYVALQNCCVLRVSCTYDQVHGTRTCCDLHVPCVSARARDTCASCDRSKVRMVSQKRAHTLVDVPMPDDLSVNAGETVGVMQTDLPSHAHEMSVDSERTVAQSMDTPVVLTQDQTGDAERTAAQSVDTQLLDILFFFSRKMTSSWSHNNKLNDRLLSTLSMRTAMKVSKLSPQEWVLEKMCEQFIVAPVPQVVPYERVDQRTILPVSPCNEVIEVHKSPSQAQVIDVPRTSRGAD